MSLLDGIVGCWSPALGATGYKLLDRGPYRNHGTLTNMDAGIAWGGVTSRNGTSVRALYFQGTDDCVTTSQRMPILESKSALSFSFWAKWKPNGFDNAGFFSYGQPGSNYTDDIFIFHSAGSYNIQINNGSDGAKVFAASAPDSLTNYTVTFNNTSVRFYIDGIEKILSGAYSYPSTTSAATSDHRMRIGTYAPVPDQWYLNGQIAELVIWNRDVAPEESKSLYQLGPGYLGRQLTGQFNRRRVFFVPSAFSSKPPLIVNQAIKTSYLW